MCEANMVGAMVRRIGVSVLLIAGLAACQATTALDEAPAPVAKAAPQWSADAVPAPAAPRRLAPAPSPLLRPDRFIGRQIDAILAELGPPSYRITHPPADIIQYRSPGCVLELYVLTDANEPQAISYAGIRGRSPDTMTEPCAMTANDLRRPGPITTASGV